MGQLVFQATAGGQVALVGPNPSSNFSLNVPAVNGNLVTTGDTGTVTNTMLASSAYTAPGTIGSGTPNTGAFTSLSATSVTDSGLTAGRVNYNGTGGLLVDSANMTFNGTSLTLANDASISGLTVGKGAGSVSTNTAFGVNALNSNTSGSQNVAIGYAALTANTTGNSNIGIGRSAMVSTTSGQSNIGIGGTYNANASLQANTTGSFNVAIGEGSLSSNTTGGNNTAIGYSAGYSNTTGTDSVFIGRAAGYSTTTAYGNIIIGVGAGYNLTTGYYNTFVGGGVYGASDGAGDQITTGSKNTIIGRYNGNQGGLDIRTASNYIVLSDGDGNPRGIFDGSGKLLIGTTSYSAYINGVVIYSDANGAVLNLGHTTGSGNGAGFVLFGYNNGGIGSITQVGTTAVAYNSTSDYRLKNDVTPIQNALSIVQTLNPISFTWVDGRKDDGFLAHELQAVIPNCVTGEKDAVDAEGKPIYQQMDNSGVIPFLVKAIQELSAEVNALKAKLGA